jgi:hypothetical protein
MEHRLPVLFKRFTRCAQSSPPKATSMGYDLSIVRLNDEDVVDIPESEWLEYVQADPELEPSEISDNSDYWEWNAHSKYHNPTEGRPWFNYWRGQIYSKNPDEEVIGKMFRIATILNAKVQGQDGEFYDEDGRQIEEPRQHDEVIRFIPKPKPWWRFW